MPQPPDAGPYPIPRRSPRFAFDALVALAADKPDASRQFWSRSTDISQGGIGLNLLDGELNPDDPVSLQVPFPTNGDLLCVPPFVIESACTAGWRSSI